MTDIHIDYVCVDGHYVVGIRNDYSATFTGSIAGIGLSIKGGTSYDLPLPVGEYDLKNGAFTDGAKPQYPDGTHVSISTSSVATCSASTSVPVSTEASTVPSSTTIP